ncbi:MAG: type II toxin-antitoxin system Phd/YefM family antitoxin [Burkholderiales bacterium]
MRTIKASEFRVKCLALLDEVQRTGVPVVVTKSGKPVAELVPHRPRAKNVRGVWKGHVAIMGDIVSPPEEKWEALK